VVPAAPQEDVADDTDAGDEPDPSDTDAADSDGVWDSGDPGDGAGPRTVLTFHQYVRYWTSYLANGHHEVRVGPDDGSAPWSADWVVALDASTAQLLAADQQWQEVSVDLTDAVAAWPAFRVSFHYWGENADNWYIDDACLSVVREGAAPECDRWAFGWEDVDVGELPEDAVGVVGPGDGTSGPRWQATSTAGPARASLRSVYISYSSDPVDQHLVLGP
jgi:hypothetical protein